MLNKISHRQKDPTLPESIYKVCSRFELHQWRFERGESPCALVFSAAPTPKEVLDMATVFKECGAIEDRGREHGL
jgi:hypothetical protein